MGLEAEIPLKDIQDRAGTWTSKTGGLYPWKGTDVLVEGQGRPKSYRIGRQFYDAFLSLFPKSAPAPGRHSILELESLGKEIWAGIDAQDYVDHERASWAG